MRSRLVRNFVLLEEGDREVFDLFDSVGLDHRQLVDAESLTVQISDKSDAFALGTHVWVRDTDQHAIISRIVENPAGRAIYVSAPGTEVPQLVRRPAPNQLQNVLTSCWHSDLAVGG